MTKQRARHQQLAAAMSTEKRIKTAQGYLKGSANASGHISRKEFETRMAGAGLVYVEGIDSAAANTLRAKLNAVIQKWS